MATPKNLQIVNIIRKQIAATMAKSLVSIQPLSMPTGHIFSMNARYDGPMEWFRFAVRESVKTYPEFWINFDHGDRVIPIVPEYLHRWPLNDAKKIALELINASSVSIEAIKDPIPELLRVHKLKWEL